MRKNTFEIKKGIKLHTIKTQMYKTDIACLILTTPLKRETVTKNALIPFLLKRGTNNFQDQYKLNMELENLYGASFNCGIDKYGDNVVLKFYMESINDEYALNNEKILSKNIQILLDIVFNPLKKDDLLNSEFLEIEKNNLRKVIRSKIDDKDAYSLGKCISIMYGNEKFGLYKFGYEEDIDNISIEEISEYYEWLKSNAKIDLFVSGKIDENEIKQIVEENENIVKLQGREENYIINNETTELKNKIDNPKIETESMDITQGKLVIGLDVTKKKKNLIPNVLVYNAILGDGASSMMFQNVREKAGLAYSARSTFFKQKLNIFIRCGIQIENYDKALKLIKKQIENIKEGKFSEEDIRNAKTYLISGLKNVEEEQDTEVVYYIGQEISKMNLELEEYMKQIEEVSKEDIVEIAEGIQINTVFFLKN